MRILVFRKRLLTKLLALLVASAVNVAAAAFFDAVYEYDGPNPPRYVALRKAAESRPQVALVLGSGGRRGFAHAGLLRALESRGIRPDLIVGVSIGSIIGALYANGMSASELEQLALKLEPCLSGCHTHSLPVVC